MSFSRHSTHITQAIFFARRGRRIQVREFQGLPSGIWVQGEEWRRMDMASGSALSSWEGRQQSPWGPDIGSEMSMERNHQE